MFNQYKSVNFFYYLKINRTCSTYSRCFTVNYAAVVVNGSHMLFPSILLGPLGWSRPRYLRHLIKTGVLLIAGRRGGGGCDHVWAASGQEGEVRRCRRLLASPPRQALRLVRPVSQSEKRSAASADSDTGEVWLHEDAWQRNTTGQ